MQTFFVIITFALAVAYLVKKFVWLPIFETRKKPSNTLDGSKIKCGKKDCGCH